METKDSVTDVEVRVELTKGCYIPPVLVALDSHETRNGLNTHPDSTGSS